MRFFLFPCMMISHSDVTSNARGDSGSRQRRLAGSCNWILHSESEWQGSLPWWCRQSEEKEYKNESRAYNNGSWTADVQEQKKETGWDYLVIRWTQNDHGSLPSFNIITSSLQAMPCSKNMPTTLAASQKKPAIALVTRTAYTVNSCWAHHLGLSSLALPIVEK